MKNQPQRPAKSHNQSVSSDRNSQLGAGTGGHASQPDQQQKPGQQQQGGPKPGQQR